MRRLPTLDTQLLDVSRKTIATGKTGTLDPKQIFSLNGRLLQVLPDQADRNLLSRRISSYLASRRRGKLRLPARFPREVRQLVDLPKRWLSTHVYWVKPNTSIEQRLNKPLFGSIVRDFPGMIWNSPSSALRHMANTVGTHRLCKTDWPGISRQRWPSTPSFSEMMAMSRRGMVTVGLDTTSYSVKNCLTRKVISDNIRIASRIVAHNIVGVRSCVPVPDKFLSWFRYRNGFLILTVRYSIPSGLVRFLLGQWVRCPFNLWLKENCSFRNFLKRHTPTEFGGVKVSSVVDELESTATEPQGVGSPDIFTFTATMDAEMLEEMGEEFADFFARLPD
jgi:hypothetical protein